MQDSIFARLEALEKHDHICHLYDNETQRFEIGAGFLLHGIKAGQKCFYVSDAPPPRELTYRIYAGGPVAEKSESRRFEQVIIRDKPGELVRADRLADSLMEKVEQICELSDHSPARVLIVYSEHYQTISGPEQLWSNAYMAKLCVEKPLIVMSQLNTVKLSASDLLSAMETHKMLVREENIYESTFYTGHDTLINKINDEYIKVDSLSRKELSILTLITSGLSNPAIAEQLSISVKTVETHRSNIMKKLDVHNLVDLVKFSIRNGIS